MYSQLVPVLLRQALNVDKCVSHFCVTPGNTPLSLQTIHIYHNSSLPGIQSEFFINTTQAGPGTLSVTIEGPSKVKMDCQEIPEGYKVMYTPMHASA